MSWLAKNWKDLTFVAFDTETTGKYPLESQLCEIAAVKWRDGEEIDSYQTLVRPDRQMSDTVISIHNITNEMVAEAPRVGEIIGEFYDFLDEAIPVAHHAPFDLGFLAPEFEAAGMELPSLPVLCTSLLSRRLIRESSNHKLQTLIKVLKIDGGQAHRALDDARACLQVAIECFSRLSESQQTLEQIVKVQQSSLNWRDYSIEDLLDQERYLNLVNAIRDRANVNLVYDGGSRPGQARTLEPIGIVRNPNGDFLVASENGRLPPKRYRLDRISSTKRIF